MKISAALACAFLAVLPAVAAEEGAGAPFEVYAGASGTLVLPQGGTRLGRLGGADAFVGFGTGEGMSLEFAAGRHENETFLSLRELVHFYAFETYDRLFGYSAFDPFFTFGASGWIGGPSGQVGPSAGIGALWHLDDNWSLRFDASATLGIDGDVEMVYSVSAGLQYAFGGGN